MITHEAFRTAENGVCVWTYTNISLLICVCDLEAINSKTEYSEREEGKVRVIKTLKNESNFGNWVFQIGFLIINVYMHPVPRPRASVTILRSIYILAQIRRFFQFSYLLVNLSLFK